jgi:serine/threonine protein kinase
LHGRSFPTGHTSGAVLKALLKYLEANLGGPAALEWLTEIRMGRDDLEDETRRVPLSVLHGALRAFVKRTSKEAIADIAEYLVAPDNLGSWVRVLRGTSNPTEAFARIDSSDSEYGRTTRWETIRAGPSFWRGKVILAHDPVLEQDGLLRLARMAELSAVPALFGLGRANVASFEAVTVRGHGQEFEVKWATPQVARAAGIGAGVGAAVGTVPVALLSFYHVAMAGLLGVVCGAAAGLGLARDRLRKAETFAQRTRVHALERSLLLREERETAAASAIEGSVVAGQYRVIRRMGSGASGVIYEAVRVSDGFPVAIKLLRAVAAQDAVASDRLRREAEALGLAWHPNVVEVLDHGHLADGTTYLVMELLHGEPLATRLRTRGKLSSAELLVIARQVCDALIAIHAAGVVHRDLKPSNIFLTFPRSDDDAPLTPRSLVPVSSGGYPLNPRGERVKLIDFGIARVEWAETRITNMGTPVGTPGYMSPEQESGGEVDARSDLFAFGAVLYECLVGEPPPPSPSGGWMASPLPLGLVGDAANLPRIEGLPRASSGGSYRRESGTHRLERIPPVWQGLIERTMAPLPRDRYQDARSVAQALRELEASLAGASASNV